MVESSILPVLTLRPFLLAGKRRLANRARERDRDGTAGFVNIHEELTVT